MDQVLRFSKALVIPSQNLSSSGEHDTGLVISPFGASKEHLRLDDLLLLWAPRNNVVRLLLYCGYIESQPSTHPQAALFLRKGIPFANDIARFFLC